MIAADQLRQALDWIGQGDISIGNPWGGKQRPTKVILGAARLWLRILEGDEQTVEKVMRAIEEETDLDLKGKLTHAEVRNGRQVARAVLAALAEGEKK